MEKTTEISLPFQITASIDQNSRILLNIDQLEYNLPIEILFDVAKRNNPKRKFLFVSKVLGKHIPIRPIVLRLIGGILARLWYEKCYGIRNIADVTDVNVDTTAYINAVNTNILVDALIKLQTTPQMDSATYSKIKASVNEILKAPLKLPESTLFIGFAETATGIAQSVFSNFTNASYIHTTREKLDALEPSFTFNEEHSHAVEHALYTLDKNFLKQFGRIVLIDDELTTGNTAINLMRNLPGNLFGLISILDWRSNEQLEKFYNMKDIDVTVCSLVKGIISELVDIPSIDCDAYDCDAKPETTNIEDIKVKISSDLAVNHKIIFIENDKNLKGYLQYTGRFGISDISNEEIQASIKKAANLLKESRTTGNCLCLGTEEFIYLPCRIAEELGDITVDSNSDCITDCACTSAGSTVFFHSTTRSPIYSKTDEAYCIKNKVEFPSPSKENVKNYLYNIPYDFYEQVYFFSEKPLNNGDIMIFNQIFNTFNIKNIIYVSWI
jgi:hypothetical protein